MEEKIGNLKPGMENISISVRVLEAGDQKVIKTRNGTRVISEAIVGDDTGRTKLTLWRKAAGSLKEGSVIKIDGAWTTAFRGQVQLNAGNRSTITEIEDNAIPSAQEIPENSPTAPDTYRPRREFRGRRPFRRREESEEEEEEE
jgi:Single-stranded DNA-binding replication protein A (RPA), large (70 kD) subunit and related ssDNA-binding proteins